MTTAEQLVGSQLPRFNTGPPYDSSPGKEAIELCAMAGLHLYPWQKLALGDSLGEIKTPQGRKWAAFEVGLIVPRQNGKGSVLEARELFGLFLEPREKLILHSAHEFKLLILTTPVLTSRGWSTMGELVDGDEVYAPDGQLTKVVTAHPPEFDQRTYRITFADGQTFCAGGEHLWAVTQVLRNGKTVERVVTTDEMRLAGMTHHYERKSRPSTGRNVYQWRVALPEPLTADPNALPIDPYLFGYWLGDGVSTSGLFTVGDEDHQDLLLEISAAGEEIQRDVRHENATGHRWYVGVRGLTTRLRELGVKGNKHIPDSYLHGSIDQRSALLAGLMDSDGTISAHQLAITMTRRDLVEQILQLVRSLGYRATIREFRARLNGEDAGPMWRVQFSPQRGNPFRLQRKRDKVKAPARASRSLYNAVVSISEVPIQPMRCITVAHETGCYLVGEGFTVTHNTASEAFLRVKTLIDSSDWLTRKVARMRTSHGEEGIELLDGSRLRFVARSTGSGRGFTADCLILDEAYNLGASEMAALLPTLGARPNPQVWYTSSAGMHQSDQLRAVRIRGRRGEQGKLRYFEWSCPEDCDLDDPANWAMANPTMGYRIGQDFIASERKALPDEAFARERLGIWAEDNQQTVIDLKLWAGCTDSESKPDGKVSFAIDAKPDRSTAAIASSGRRSDGLLHTKIVDHRPGMGWIVERLAQLNERYKPVAVLLDPAGPAGSLLADLAEVGIEPHLVSAREMGQACGAFHTDVVNDQLRHVGQDTLTQALRQATTRNLGDAWAWDRRHGRGDISPLVAATLACHGFRTFGGVEAAQSWIMFE